MNKPIKPDITIPESFAENGIKTDFDSDLIIEGFDRLRPRTLDGDSLNKFIDDTYKGLNYGMAAADAINLINEGETLTVVNGELTSGASGGGLEIGDIGPAPLGIDETKGKRRYLNGQVIIQDQYLQFTNKVKSAQDLYPNLFVTEEQWQATVTMSAFGACYKFVVDDEAGTIRLPKITGFIQGLTDLSKLGDLVEAGVPNITGTGKGTGDNANYTGAFKATGGSTGTNGGYNNTASLNYDFNASRSSSIYGNSPTVQPESGRYPYFIQVATGAETEDNIINEIELNNPYSFGDSKYSPLALNNLSWLKSEGQWNSKATYPSFYDWALINLNNDVEGFASSTGAYTDYDFVLNTAEETFRLPLLDGSESLPSNEVVNLGSLSTETTYVPKKNGYILISGTSKAAGNYVSIYSPSAGTYGSKFIAQTSSQPVFGTVEVKKGLTYIIDYTATLTGLYFTPATGNGSLYYYVGETVQNANLINAGRIEEKIHSLIPDNSSLISGYGMPSDRYIDLTLGASGATYTMPSNGWLCCGCTGSGSYVELVNYKNNAETGLKVSATATYVGGWARASIPVSKGDTVNVYYGGTFTLKAFRFVYAQGSESEAN